MDPSTRIASKVAALADLGFRRVDAYPMPVESTPVSGGRHRVTAAHPSMGTLVSVTAIHRSRDLMEEGIGRAFSEMDRLVGLLNRYDPASALWYLNDLGTISSPPPELRAVLAEALSHHRKSLGAFDPTVQPLIDLFRHRTQTPASTGGFPEPPPPEEIQELLPLVDAAAVEVGAGVIRFGKEGMGITLDGIAKGYVVDRVAETLLSWGLENFLINAGGDIRSEGVREDGRSWRVAVQDPQKAQSFPDVIPLRGAVATSGSYEIYFDPEQKNHHIIDSQIGVSPEKSQSVSVVAPTAMEADALATSVFLLGPDRGAAFIESFPGCACLIVDRHGRQVRSDRWRSAAESLTPKAETS